MMDGRTFDELVVRASFSNELDFGRAQYHDRRSRCNGGFGTDPAVSDGHGEAEGRRGGGVDRGLLNTGTWEGGGETCWALCIRGEWCGDILRRKYTRGLFMSAGCLLFCGC